MTRLVSTLFITLDGVAEIDPDWHFPYFDDAMGSAVADDYAGTDVLLLGRVTYDSFAGAWPQRETAGGDDADFARQLGDTPKVVLTRRALRPTPEDPAGHGLGWRNVEAAPDLLGAVAELRRRPGVDKVLVAGSVSVVRQLLDAGELDELRLLVHPIVARHGTRLFESGPQNQTLTLLSSEALPTGVLRLRYAPERVAAQTP